MEAEERAKLDNIAAQNALNAQRYHSARKEAAKAKFELDVILGAKLLNQQIPASMAYEKALIMVACESEENKKLYETLEKATAAYKGWERVIEANAEQIRWAQSKLKYTREGEMYG